MRKHRRNVTIIHNEIDYDKLAEAIVRAQQQMQMNNRQTGKWRSAAMNFFNGAVYALVYTLAGLFIYTIWSISYRNQEASLTSCIICTIILTFIGVYAFLCQQETFLDKRTEVREHFNSNISLIALIVALVALIKG